MFTQLTRLLPWLMWGSTTLFFAYQFIMRLTPGLLMPELMQKFSVDATDYGFFAAIYYFAYSGMQIPIALLLDRFGPRVVVASSILACSIGTFLLAYTDCWNLALFSRFLIGAGSAAGFLGVSKVVASRFPEKLYTKMIGFTFTFGLLGAVYGGKPVGSLIAHFGWVEVLAIVGLLGLGIFLLVALLVRGSSSSVKIRYPNQDQIDFGVQETSILHDLKTVVCNRSLLLIALANFLMVGALEGFADVWGVPFLSTTHNMLKEEAAQVVSFIFVGMLFGGPILAYAADKLRCNYRVASLAGFCMGLIFIVLLMFHTNLELSALYVLLFLTGIFCCYQVLIFSMGVSLVPKQLASLAVAFLNCINMLGGSFFHSLIGYGMDFFWTGSMKNGIRVYDSHAFTYALSPIAITAILGALLLLIAKQKNTGTVLTDEVEELPNKQMLNET